MDWKNIIEWVAIVSWLGGIIVWMISHQLVIHYTQKNLKPIYKCLYGYESRYERKLNMYEMMFMTSIANVIFYQYHLIYKRKGYFPMFKKGKGSMYPNLNEETALLLIKNYYKWLVLNVVSLGLGFFWLFGSSFFIWLADRIVT